MQRIQIHTHTYQNRELNVLRTASKRLSETKPEKRLKVLSFGCSIGEEILGLKSVFNDHDVFGCEILGSALNVAKQTCGHFADVFLSTDKNIIEKGPFDLILASAVLCVNPAPKDINTTFSHDKFETITSLLSSAVSSGGLLAISNSNYHFSSSSSFGQYRTIRSDAVFTNGFVNIYDVGGNLVLKQVNAPGFSCYQRQNGYVISHDEFLVDCLFEKTFAGIQEDDAAVFIEVTSSPDDLGDHLFSFERKNTDGFLDEVPPDLIEITTKRDVYRRNKTGDLVEYIELQWPSATGEGLYTRPGFWVDFPRFSTRKE